MTTSSTPADRTSADAAFAALAQRLANANDVDFCRSMLQHVSRTFALTIPYLPSPLDTQVGVGYLLCRIADTIEDDPAWSGADRQRAFDLLHAAFDADDAGAAGEALADFAGPHTADNAEGLLLRRSGAVCRLFASFPAGTRAAIADCVREMIAGMRRTPAATDHGETRRVCRSLDDLEDYCHYVAGVVGLMLTRLFDGALGSQVGFATPQRMEQGRQFGLGLQLTNILADRVTDRAHGKVYLPDFGSTADTVARVADRAVQHLRTAMRYSAAIPTTAPGIRAFCLLPVFMAARTLRRVMAARTGDAVARPKISRAEVTEIVAKVNKLLKDDAALSTSFEQEVRECIDQDDSPRDTA